MYILLLDKIRFFEILFIKFNGIIYITQIHLEYFHKGMGAFYYLAWDSKWIGLWTKCLQGFHSKLFQYPNQIWSVGKNKQKAGRAIQQTDDKGQPQMALERLLQANHLQYWWAGGRMIQRERERENGRERVRASENGIETELVVHAHNLCHYDELCWQIIYNAAFAASVRDLPQVLAPCACHGAAIINERLKLSDVACSRLNATAIWPRAWPQLTANSTRKSTIAVCSLQFGPVFFIAIAFNLH